MSAPSIFVSYSHDDQSWLDRLVKHLGVIQHQTLVEIWTDRRIEAGAGWYEEIGAALTAAKVAVLLITPSFLDSQFIRTEEVPRLLQRRSVEGLSVVPIVVKPCAWDLVPWLKEMQPRPRDAHALSRWNNRQLLGLLDLRASDNMAEELSAVSSTRPLWPEFTCSERSQFMELFSEAPDQQWGVASRRRSVGPGYEVVLLAPLGEHEHGYVVTQPTAIESVQILMHFTAEGWKVAAYNSCAAPQPGWPPAWWIHDPVAAAATDQMLIDHNKNK